MIKDFTPRLYQETILATAAMKNTLVVLPTALGKTNIFLMLASLRLKNYPNSKILLIGPTRPLIDQYLAVFMKNFSMPESEMAVLTGFVRPDKRAELWKKSRIIFSTPQGLENDIISNRIDLSEVSLLGFDEAHRAVGDYAYVFVAREYVKRARFPRIIAMTASPGSDNEKITEVCQNLFIEDVEVRTYEDPDVKKYIQEIDVQWVKVNLPEPFKVIQKDLKAFIKSRVQKLKDWGVLRRKDINFVSKTELLKMQGEIRARISSGEKDFVMWNSISVLAEIMKVSHALELLETQGIVPLHKYMKGLYDDSFKTKVKAVKNLAKDPAFKSALLKAEALFERGIHHPKIEELKVLVKKELEKDPSSKILVFNQYRDNAQEVVRRLNEIPGVKAELFVGQMKKGNTGLSQKEQKAVLDKFRSGELNVLGATSVGEEGLDLPGVPLVIFYEPIPSAIRHIQRRGRTGRHEKGRVFVLMTKDTLDEGYRWSAHHKEKRMYRTLKDIKSKISSVIFQKKQPTLQDYVPEEKRIIIFADHREKASRVIKELLDLKVDLKLEQLESADYLLSSRCAVEYKTKIDFINSIIDGRLLDQLKNIKRNYERPLIIIEGEEDIYSIRNIHPNAIRGMLATIAVSYGIPIIQTKDNSETASIMHIIARREQEKQEAFQPHGSRKPFSIKELQEYIVAALPGVGATLSKPLLKKFKTIKKIANAKQEQLEKIDKIGPTKAKQIREVLDKEYEST